MFIAVRPSRSSADLFISRYVADDARLLSICSLFLPRNALPSIFLSIISYNKTFSKHVPSHLCFRCQIVFNMHLS